MEVKIPPEGINVVSAFDGMSCLQIALQRLGIKVNNYFAIEIDKYAIQVTQANFQNTIQLGDITKVTKADFKGLHIHIYAGGSPCQGFSFAGKQLAFDDPRSKLFFEYVRLKNELQPDFFLLENVDMKKEYLKIISEYVGIYPQNINSALVSAQNRSRNYWSNIKTENVGLFQDLYTAFPQPKDKGILLKDILQPENEVDKKYYISEAQLNRILRTGWSNPQLNPEKTGAILPKNNSGQLSIDSGTTLITPDGNLKPNQDKAGCFTAGGHSGGYHSDMDLVCIAMRGREDTSVLSPKRTEYGKQIRKDYEAGNIKEQRKNIQQLEPRNDSKTNTLTSVQKDNLVMIQLPHGTNQGGEVAKNGKTPSMTKSAWEHNNLLQIASLYEITCACGNIFTGTLSDPCPKCKEIKSGSTNEIKDNVVICGDYRSDEGFRPRKNGKAPTLTKGSDNSGTQYNALIQIASLYDNNAQGGRIYSDEGKSTSQNSQSGGVGAKTGLYQTNSRIRRLTEVECERLQCVDDNYTNHVSSTQRYKMLGNGWTISVITHMLSFLPKEYFQ